MGSWPLKRVAKAEKLLGPYLLNALNTDYAEQLWAIAEQVVELESKLPSMMLDKPKDWAL